MIRIFAIGDIHGCKKTFEKMLFDEIGLKKSDVIYCIGDYIDRGPDSKGVIDLILELRDQQYQIHTLRGNHEQLLLDALDNHGDLSDWIFNGGDTTLKSFDISSLQNMDAKYIDFFRQTEFYFLLDNYVLVHAGLNFENEDPFEDRHAMLWIRNFTPDPKRIGNRVIVHGHTPRSLRDILQLQLKNTFNIDAGCVYVHRDSQGHLVALDLLEQKFLVVKNCE